MKREITPHRGGVTEKVNARLTPDDLLKLRYVLDGEESFSEWLRKHIREDYDKLTPDQLEDIGKYLS